MVPRATFATLRELLLDLGFTENAVDGKSVRFIGDKPNTRFRLPWFWPDEEVDAGNLVGVRFALDARGLLRRDEFDRLLREKALAG